MEIQNLAQRLRHPDPRIRVETLRILAMVEETRALDAIRWIYKNDPESGVREVAAWAGRLIWQAHKRGHSTQRAVEELFAQPLSPEREQMFLQTLVDFDKSLVGHRATRKYAAEMAYQRRIDEALHGPSTEEDGTDDETPALPTPGATWAVLGGNSTSTARDQDPPPDTQDNPQPGTNHDDLLDAGLTNLDVE